MPGPRELARDQPAPAVEPTAEPPEAAGPPHAKHRHLLWLGVLAGAVLAVIGARFLIVPDQAARTFGLGREIVGQELYHVIGLRDLWLGALAVLLALLREWRALALWLALGALVCLGDAAIVARSTAKWRAIGFHLGSAVFCGWLAAACWRAWRRNGQGKDADAPPGRTSGPFP